MIIKNGLTKKVSKDNISAHQHAKSVCSLCTLVHVQHLITFRKDKILYQNLFINSPPKYFHLVKHTAFFHFLMTPGED